MNHPRSRRSYVPPFVLVVLTGITRLVYVGYERTVWGDEPFYLWLGRNWFRGDGYSFAFSGHWDYHHTPGYPFITGVLALLTRDMQRASDWSYILFSVLLVCMVYGVARRVYGIRSAFAAGVIVALAPAMAIMPLFWGTMTEVPYLAMAFTGVFFAHRAYRQPRALDAGLAGVFFALAYYVRPEVIVYLGAMGLVLGLRALVRPPHTFRATIKRLGYPALLGILFLAALFPYLYQVRQETGAWTVSQKVGTHFATASGLASGRFQQFDIETWGLDSGGLEVIFFSTDIADASASEYILADPGGYLKTIYGNTLDLLNELNSPHLLPSFALLFIGLALLRWSWHRGRAWDEFFLMATLLPGLSFILFFVQERYIATLIPTLFIWFGHGVMESGDWLAQTLSQLRHGDSSTVDTRGELPRSTWGRSLVWIPLFLLALFMLFWTPRQIATATNPGSTRAVHNLASTALVSITAPDDIVMARYVSIPFHAGAEWIPTPAATIDEVLTYARNKGADYWAIDGFEAHSLRPQFSQLIDDPLQPPAGLEFVTQVDDGGEPVVIYRIMP